MTRIDLRIGGTTFPLSSTGIILACAIVCAVLIMGFYVSTLRVAVQRGESLREAQRAGTTLQSPLSAPKKVLALAR